MPNLLPESITKEDITSYLDSSSDFQFEMEIFQCCVKHELDSKHGGSYTDPVTGVSRQFDIRAARTNSFYAGLQTTLNLAIECKNLRPNFPLLVSCVPRLREESYHHAILNGVKWSNKPDATGHGVHVTGINRETLKFGYMNGSIFQPEKPVGKSTVQVGKSNDGTKTGWKFSCNDDDVHDGWSQAIASAYDLIASAYTADFSTDQQPMTSVVFPVLVVPDGMLWVVEYSPEGKRKGEPSVTDECQYYLGKNFPNFHPINDYWLSHLLMFTKSGLDRFLSELRRSSQANQLWEKFFPDIEIRDAIKKLGAPPTKGVFR